MELKYILSVLLAVLVSAIVGAFMIPRLLRICVQKRLYDTIDERKIHFIPIPRLGGVAFLPVSLFTYCFIMGGWQQLNLPIMSRFCEHYGANLFFYICGITLIYLIGIADDLVGVRYRNKLIVQIIGAVLLICSGLYIKDLYGFLGMYQIPAFVGIALTVLMIIFITNAINLIDGIDGLASGLSMILFGFLALLFIIEHNWMYAVFSVSTFGVLIPFFFINVFGNAEKQKKIFMGDAGSLTLGFTMSFLIIAYCNDAIVVEYDFTDVLFHNRLIVALSALIIPCFDVFRVILVRLRNGKSPFMPDKNHIHHKLMAIGLKPRKVLIVLLLLGVFYCAFNLILLEFCSINSTILVGIDLAIWIGLHLWWDKLIQKKAKLVTK